jgi:hypothetical protein
MPQQALQQQSWELLHLKDHYWLLQQMPCPQLLRVLAEILQARQAAAAAAVGWAGWAAAAAEAQSLA